MSTVISDGTQLGSFRLVQKIALGGMAEIWAADDAEGRRVALKVMYPSFAQELEFQTMFRDEVNIARRLEHPNILQVFGHGQEDGHTFQVMELVEGIDLRRLLSITARAGGWLPVPIVLWVGSKMASALAYAHDKKGDDGVPLAIVHRDVSPHNVLLARDGHTKLLDFGIAKATERLTRTRTGVIKGKVSYMAPEQAMGTEVSGQTDIFALAIVMWEMLSMRRLFKAASDPETLQLVVECKLPALRHHNPVVPEELESLLVTMLARDPQARPASMATVAQNLDQLMREVYADDTYGLEPLAALVGPHAPKLDTPRKRTRVMPKASGATVKTQVTKTNPAEQEATLSGMLTPNPDDDD